MPYMVDWTYLDKTRTHYAADLVRIRSADIPLSLIKAFKMTKLGTFSVADEVVMPVGAAYQLAQHITQRITRDYPGIADDIPPPEPDYIDVIEHDFTLCQTPKGT